MIRKKPRVERGRFAELSARAKMSKSQLVSASCRSRTMIQPLQNCSLQCLQMEHPAVHDKWINRFVCSDPSGPTSFIHNKQPHEMQYNFVCSMHHREHYATPLPDQPAPFLHQHGADEPFRRSFQTHQRVCADLLASRHGKMQARGVALSSGFCEQTCSKRSVTGRTLGDIETSLLSPSKRFMAS